MSPLARPAHALRAVRRPRTATLVAVCLAALAAAPAAAHAQERDYGAQARASDVANIARNGDDVSAYRATAYISATASASFFNGTLRAAVTTSEEGGYGCGWWQAGCWWGSSASATIWDRVTIGPSPYGGPVTWSFRIDGTGHKGNRLGNGQWSAETQFFYGRLQDHETVQRVRLKSGEVEYSGTLQLGDAPLELDLFMGLYVSASNSAWVDYGHTMRFSWTLPVGATYTSASGALVAPTYVTPTNPPAPPVPPTTPVPTVTPEPGALALLATGLAALALGARRRRAVRA